MPFVTLEAAIQRLKAHGVVAVPTETVYGLAGLIHDEAALKEIFALKKRPFFDPLIVHVEGIEAARPLVADWPPVLEELARQFWPGPLTLIAPKTPQVTDLITSGLPTVALRSPSHPIARQILAAAGAFAAPSANLFGRTSPTLAEHVANEFPDLAVLDGGPCQIGVESTVVQLSGSNLQILRPGRILASHLQPIANKYGLVIHLQPAAASPGHLPHHYQPAVPLILVKSHLDEKKLHEQVASFLNKTNFVFTYLDLPTNPSDAARILYAELRRLSQSPNNVIVAEPSKWSWSEENSIDLMDRITRAASLII